MSEDNLASAECGTPAYRTPSYIRVSCALSGYTKSPRHLENSASRAMGRSLVERRLGMFDASMSSRYVRSVYVCTLFGDVSFADVHSCTKLCD
ncbi:hypothetical protein ANCCAN_10217 [Ancylostoma caninum]|uniref:Uncharacterized protein n=1 Tax=Ancylostoma caninum TaxID=29170 RepID=A0A368GJG8_ANCCA|nr:hypothetical protein ANCCAN_10217 [Ancylostoma caninum]